MGGWGVAVQSVRTYNSFACPHPFNVKYYSINTAPNERQIRCVRYPGRNAADERTSSAWRWCCACKCESTHHTTTSASFTNPSSLRSRCYACLDFHLDHHHIPRCSPFNHHFDHHSRRCCSRLDHRLDPRSDPRSHLRSSHTHHAAKCHPEAQGSHGAPPVSRLAAPRARRARAPAAAASAQASSDPRS